MYMEPNDWKNQETSSRHHSRCMVRWVLGLQKKTTNWSRLHFFALGLPSTYEAVYWICWMCDYSNKYILSFNVGSETFEILELGVLTLKFLQTSSIGVSIGVFKREEGGFIFCEIWVRT